MFSDCETSSYILNLRQTHFQLSIAWTPVGSAGFTFCCDVGSVKLKVAYHVESQVFLSLFGEISTGYMHLFQAWGFWRSESLWKSLSDFANCWGVSPQLLLGFRLLDSPASHAAGMAGFCLGAGSKSWLHCSICVLSDRLQDAAPTPLPVTVYFRCQILHLVCRLPFIQFSHGSNVLLLYINLCFCNTCEWYWRLHIIKSSDFYFLLYCPN